MDALELPPSRRPRAAALSASPRAWRAATPTSNTPVPSEIRPLAGRTRRFFENWRESLKWQRLKPFEKFAAMIDRHWDGIAAYCKPENKVALGFVEGLNNKIRVIQRRSYGLRDEEYLALKVLTCMLNPI